MTDIAWKLIGLLSKMLEPEEREAVIGDIIESRADAWSAAADVAGLAMRRQLLEWRSWKPWLAAFGLALPASLLLMGLSLTVSRAYQDLLNPAVHRVTGLWVGAGFWLFLCNVLLLLGWAWSGGQVLSMLSRRTLWISVLFSFAPCLFCLTRFRVESMSRFCLLLFLVPALGGILRGLRVSSISFGPALMLALGVTALTIPSWGNHGAWLPNWALSWPAWFLVAAARKAA